MLDLLAPDNDRDRQQEKDPELAPEYFRVVPSVLVVMPSACLRAVL
jgi:hypothetical protein